MWSIRGPVLRLRFSTQMPRLRGHSVRVRAGIGGPGQPIHRQAHSRRPTPPIGTSPRAGERPSRSAVAPCEPLPGRCVYSGCAPPKAGDSSAPVRIARNDARLLPHCFHGGCAWKQPRVGSLKIEITSAGCWSERRDLNSGPPVPQTGALTGLRYAPPAQSSTPHGLTAQGRSNSRPLARFPVIFQRGLPAPPRRPAIAR